MVFNDTEKVGGGVLIGDIVTITDKKNDDKCDDPEPLDVILITVVVVIFIELFLFILIRIACRRCGGRSIELVVKASDENVIGRVEEESFGTFVATGYHGTLPGDPYDGTNAKDKTYPRTGNASESICGFPSVQCAVTPQDRVLPSRSLTNWGFAVEEEIHRGARRREPSVSSSVLTSSSFQSIEDISFRDDFALLDDLPSDMEESQTTTVGGKLVVYISKLVDHNGASLVLDKMGISMYIPPGAVDTPEKIFLILNWDLGDFPSMLEDQTIISPVVHCGPHGLQLKKPATLTYKHCADVQTDVKVFSSETHLLENKLWTMVGDEEHGNNSYAILASECQIQIAHFTHYTCLAQGGPSTKKWIQLVAFGGKMRPQQHFEIRVYLLNNTPCALQYAIQNEEKQGFKQLGTEWKFLFNGSSNDMFLKVESLNEGWSCGLNLDDRQEKVPFLSIWHGKCPHVSFVFKHENGHVRDISVKLSAYQDSLENEKRTLRIVNCMKRGSIRSRASIDSSESARSSQCSLTDGESNCSSRSNSFSQIHALRGVRSTYTIPYKLRRELIVLLDPTSVLGNDWRVLAEALGADAQIPMLRNERNPTDCLLEEVEHQGKSLGWLADVLQEKKRLDAASVIRDYITSSKKRKPEQ